jgi:hypothetical protein
MFFFVFKAPFINTLAFSCFSLYITVTAADLTLYTCADDNHWVYVDGVLQASNTGLMDNAAKVCL